jgi:hypothetical protein
LARALAAGDPASPRLSSDGSLVACYCPSISVTDDFGLRALSKKGAS